MYSIKQSRKENEDRSIGNMSENYGCYAKSQKQCCKYLHEQYLKNVLDERLRTILMEKGDSKEASNARHLCFVDYGAADTRNSLEMYEDIIQKVHSFNQFNVESFDKNRRIHFDLGVQDLPGNNWSLAKRNIQNNIASKYDNTLHESLLSFDSDNSTYEVTEFKGSNLTVTFYPSSFYNTKSLSVKRDAVDIAFTSIATHWLSSDSMQKYDLKLLNSMSPSQKHTTPSELQSFVNASMEDGIDFLVARGMELRNGGTLLMCNLAKITSGDAKSSLNNFSEVTNNANTRKTNHKYYTYLAIFEDMHSLLNDWKQRPGIKIKFPLIPAYSKSPKDWEKCFSNPNVVKTGLVLKHTETRIFANPYYQEIIENSTSSISEGKDVQKKNKEFADEYMKSIMAWGHKVFMKIFDGNMDMEFQFCEELKQKFISVNPERYNHDFAVFICEAIKN